MQKNLVKNFRKLKKALGMRTWQLEAFIVAIVLIVIAIISKKGLVEWIGVLAVFFTFLYSSVSDRLHEAQEKLFKEKGAAEVHCYWKLPVYYYIKETIWFAYFLILGAWSALAGIFIFLLYGWWRKIYRQYK